MKSEKKYESVGNIRIKEPKKKKNKKQNDSTSTGVKILVWFMFFAMLASFLAPILYNLYLVVMGE